MRYFEFEYIHETEGKQPSKFSGIYKTNAEPNITEMEYWARKRNGLSDGVIKVIDTFNEITEEEYKQKEIEIRNKRK